MVLAADFLCPEAGQGRLAYLASRPAMREKSKRLHLHMENKTSGGELAFWVGSM
jgi:hypothetical protein